MKARAGVTLIEVLIAIFIMAIGLLALLTLFPMGALSMAQALRDDRCHQAGQQANNLANALNVRNDTAPGLQAAFTNNGTTKLRSNWIGPSFPVFVDPWGMRIGASSTLGPVVRTDLSFTTTRPKTMRYCALQDELTFQDNGTPDTTSGLQREPKTTWAYWLRRPNNTMPNVVEMWVVVYSGRNLQLGSNETQLTNVLYNGGDATLVGVPATTDIRRGMWIVDVTTHDPVADAANAQNYGPVQGIWYRVVDTTDSPLGTQLDLQPKPAVPMTQVILMEDVVEVFYKGTGWK
jgi:prepilin-type N-terminal cleavage/methylation domain-containing protein